MVRVTDLAPSLGFYCDHLLLVVADYVQWVAAIMAGISSMVALEAVLQQALATPGEARSHAETRERLLVFKVGTLAAEELGAPRSTRRRLLQRCVAIGDSASPSRGKLTLRRPRGLFPSRSSSAIRLVSRVTRRPFWPGQSGHRRSRLRHPSGGMRPELLTMMWTLKKIYQCLVPRGIRMWVAAKRRPPMPRKSDAHVLSPANVDAATAAMGCARRCILSPPEDRLGIAQEVTTAAAVRDLGNDDALLIVRGGVSDAVRKEVDDAAQFGAKILPIQSLRCGAVGKLAPRKDAAEPPAAIAVDKSGPYNFRIRCPKLNLLFYEVPKNASSTVKNILFDLEVDGKLSGRHAGFMAPAKWQEAYPQMVARHGDSGWASLFRFAFLRNPHARIFPGFNNAGHSFRYPGMTFEEFVLRLPEAIEAPNSDMIRIHHKPFEHFVPKGPGGFALDFIGKVETFDKDMRQLLEWCGFEPPADLPVINPSNSGAYREHYNPEMRRIVESLYGPEIELGRYCF